MVEKNGMIQSTNDIFPIAVKFRGSSGQLQLRQTLGVSCYEKLTRLFFVSASSASDGGIGMDYCSLPFDSVIEEIITARKENRYADLTRLEPCP